MTNRGALALCAMQLTVEAQAELFGKSVRTVYNWRKGRIKPRHGEERRTVHEKGGPSPELWDQPVAAAEVGLPEVVAAVPGSATPESVADEADDLLADVRNLRNRWAAMGGDLEGQTRGLERCSSMMKTLATLRGTLMSPRQLLASPHWRRIADAMQKALEPYPDAMQAVTAALIELDGPPE